MKNRRIILACLIALNILISGSIIAQKSLVHTDSDQDYKKAIELFQNEKYGAARNIFQLVVEKYDDEQSLLKTNAEYYKSLCAIELFHRDAGFLIDKFIFDHPNDPRINDLYYQMGKFQYRKKKYSKTINWFKKVDKSLLNKEDRLDYYFQLGYSYFVKEEYDKARINFFEIKDIDSEYNAPANYFYSHIAYIEGNYQTALNGFEKIKDNEMFKPIVPYYLTHIYYKKNDFDEIKSTSPALLDQSTPKRAPEIARIIGEAYFQTGDYNKAIPYLERYKKESANYLKQDYYQLGYTYYKLGNFDKAITNLEKVVIGNSKLAQYSYYYLADCYIKTKDMQKAQMAFDAASKMDFNKTIEEESLFNFAKLSFEMSYSPFNQTIKTFNSFIQKFPYSDHLDQAYDYLVKVYLATKNYGQALASLEKINNKNENIEKAYQRVAFFRGIELFSSLEFKRAISFFNKSLKYGQINPEFNSQALFWKAESYYRLKEYPKSIDTYLEFLHSPRAIFQDEYNIAHYNLAYAYFKNKDYADAIIWFRKYTNKNSDATNTLSDSYIRIADCYFVQRNYADAVKYYDLAISMNLSDMDYATYQKAFSYGLLKKHDKKNWVLRNMVKDYPESGYKVDALYELGKSYVSLNNPEKALESYQLIIDNFPQSNYVKKAYLQKGLVYYNLNDNEHALEAYKKIVKNYSGTSEAKSALTGIRNIYLEMHREDEYFAYTESLSGNISISTSEKDSLTYSSAEKLYMQAEYAKAAEHFKKYINNFKDGSYLLEANYFKADCNLQNGDTLEALNSFNYIISKPRNRFTEDALVKAGKINYNNLNFSEALDNYQMLEAVADVKNNLLEARIGQMRCSFKLHQDSLAIIAANKVLISDKVPEEVINEAHFVLAKSFLNQNDMLSAINEFKHISEFLKTPMGAEAKFRVIEILVEQNKLDEAEQEIVDFNNKNTPHQYWLARAIIKLADIYVQRDDDFQARHTLQSIVQYYDNKNDGIIAMAEEKLNEIEEREEAGTMMNEVKDIELDFNKDKDENYNELFEEGKGTNNPDSLKTEKPQQGNLQNN